MSRGRIGVRCGKMHGGTQRNSPKLAARGQKPGDIYDGDRNAYGNNSMKWQDRISIKADVCHGKACIRGRRVMVSVILASLAEGDSPQTIMANYHLAPEDIQAAMLFAADMAEDRFLPLEQEVG